jgi:hypothetical protein
VHPRLIGVGVWLFAALALRRAQSVGPVRARTGLIRPSGTLAIVSILLLGVAGLYMAITAWGEQATWIMVATVGFLLLAPFGAFAIDPRLRALATAAATASERPKSLAAATAEQTLPACRAEPSGCQAVATLCLVRKWPHRDTLFRADIGET